MVQQLRQLWTKIHQNTNESVQSEIVRCKKDFKNTNPRVKSSNVRKHVPTISSFRSNVFLELEGVQKHGYCCGGRRHNKHKIDMFDQNRRQTVQKSCVVEKVANVVLCPDVKNLRDPSRDYEKCMILFRLVGS